MVTGMKMLPRLVSFAAAAAVVLAVWLGRPARIAHEPLPVAAVRGDLDGSGRVDILDAFVFSRRIERDNQISPEWDFNGDGKVDRKDVDTVAGWAVKLERG